MKNILDVWRPEQMNPWRELVSLQKQMDRLFTDFSRVESNDDYEKDVDFVPACDFEETENAYLISLDVPGIRKDELQVELSGNTLTIAGEQSEEKKEGKGAQRSYERYHGRFERSFTLPQVAESEKVEADYKDGVLRIALPKSEAMKMKTRRIQIGEGKSTFFGKITGRNDDKKASERAA